MLVGLGRLAGERPDVLSVDINPLIVQPDGSVIAVDGFVEIDSSTTADDAAAPRQATHPPTHSSGRSSSPAACSSPARRATPASSGSSRCTTCSPAGYAGGVFGTNLKGEEVLGIKTVADIADLPDDAIDLVFVCTPAAANPDLLRACAAKGIRAAFLTSAGYGEAGDEGRERKRQLVALADELGILLAGPNGQGVVSTPANLCAQIVAPYPPAGHIGVASQSGNFVSTFLNLSRLSGVGISRAVSAGNAAAVTVADYLNWYATDDATTVGLAYVEGITDGRALMDRLAATAAVKPLVLVKGGATEGGAHAAASHTGALAANDKIFDGECRAAGITRAGDVDRSVRGRRDVRHAAAAEGPEHGGVDHGRRMGGRDRRCDHRDGDLVLMELPADLQAAIDEKLPPRWSSNNPVDCAGGETRDTIPEVLELIASHPAVDAVIYLGSASSRTRRG